MWGAAGCGFFLVLLSKIDFISGQLNLNAQK